VVSFSSLANYAVAFAEKVKVGIFSSAIVTKNLKPAIKVSMKMPHKVHELCSFILGLGRNVTAVVCLVVDNVDKVSVGVMEPFTSEQITPMTLSSGERWPQSFN
jgi:hypothetical protein